MEEGTELWVETLVNVSCFQIPGYTRPHGELFSGLAAVGSRCEPGQVTSSFGPVCCLTNPDWTQIILVYEHIYIWGAPGTIKPVSCQDVGNELELGKGNLSLNTQGKQNLYQ